MMSLFEGIANLGDTFGAAAATTADSAGSLVSADKPVNDVAVAPAAARKTEGPKSLDDFFFSPGKEKTRLQPFFSAAFVRKTVIISPSTPNINMKNKQAKDELVA